MFLCLSTYRVVVQGGIRDVLLGGGGVGVVVLLDQLSRNAHKSA